MRFTDKPVEQNGSERVPTLPPPVGSLRWELLQGRAHLGIYWPALMIGLLLSLPWGQFQGAPIQQPLGPPVRPPQNAPGPDSHHAIPNNNRLETFQNSIGMTFVRIPAGTFEMGTSPDEKGGDFDESPRHRVRISRAFFLGTCEVTQRDFRMVTGENPCWFSKDGPGRREVQGLDSDLLPVDMVSWQQAVDFCRALSALPEERKAGRTYRLPTEAEWEYACRARTTTTFSQGESLSHADACFQDGDVRPIHPAPVGSFKPNEFGLYDMHGNVWEWCADWYQPEIYRGRAVNALTSDPQGPSEGTGRVVRGGSFQFDMRYARSANRDFTRATRRDLGNGFRVLCEIPLEKKANEGR